MKRHDIVLFLLLAIAAGWIVWTQVRKDPALEEARNEIAAARSAGGMLAQSNIDRAQIIEQQNTTITRQAGRITSLEGHQAAAHDISAVAIQQGADLETAFDAGEPIVQQANIPALTEWYEAVRTQYIPPLLATNANLNGTIESIGVEIAGIKADNASLTADNTVLKAQSLLDGTMIADLNQDLKDADGKIAEAQNAGRLEGTLLKIGIAAAIVYFGGDALGAW